MVLFDWMKRNSWTAYRLSIGSCWKVTLTLEYQVGAPYSFLARKDLDKFVPIRLLINELKNIQAPNSRIWRDRKTIKIWGRHLRGTVRG